MKMILQIDVLQRKNVTLVLKYVNDVSRKKISTIAKIQLEMIAHKKTELLNNKKFKNSKITTVIIQVHLTAKSETSQTSILDSLRTTAQPFCPLNAGATHQCLAPTNLTGSTLLVSVIH